MNLLKLLYRPFCQHAEIRHVTVYTVPCGNGKHRLRHVWECLRCGRRFETDGIIERRG